jgi:hypothetical protein
VCRVRSPIRCGHLQLRGGNWQIGTHQHVLDQVDVAVEKMFYGFGMIDIGVILESEFDGRRSLFRYQQ